MSFHESHNVRHPERCALDRIRRELGMDRQVNPCPVCGDSLGGTAEHPEPCEMCGGKRVRAANLLRCIREMAQPTEGGRYCERPNEVKLARQAGQVESAAPVTSGRAYVGRHNG